MPTTQKVSPKRVQEREIKRKQYEEFEKCMDAAGEKEVGGTRGSIKQLGEERWGHKLVNNALKKRF